MAQADGVVANGSGSAVRADINAQLAAAFTNHSGTTQPSTTFAYQNWVDESSGVLKIRNKQNSSWIDLRRVFKSSDDSNTAFQGSVIIPDGSASEPSVYFSSNTDTGIFRSIVSGTPTGGALAFTLNGSAHAIFGRTLDSQDNAIVFGPAAYRTTALNPTNGSNDTTVAGVCIADDGPVHIGTYNERSVTLNLMGPSGTTGQMVRFNFNGSPTGGHITYNGAGVSYVTSSDYRLKENVVTLSGAKDRLNQLRPYRFNFIQKPDQIVDGFLAHEAQEVVPEAITGIKDATFADGSPDYQGIDQSKLVPLLTAALQEAFAEIAALTARVETLEAG